MTIDVVILAAGQGTRMKSTLPKVLHHLGGKPLIQHVVNTATTVPNSDITIVTGYASEQIITSVVGDNLRYVYQKEQLGTAHAVKVAISSLTSKGTTLVVYGDVPLISSETLMATLDVVNNNTMGLLTAHNVKPEGYGRVLRDKQGQIYGIVEQKDATLEEQKIQEVNTGVMAIRTDRLQEWLPQIENDNAQNEYYLTDLIAIANREGIIIKSVQPGCLQEVEGVNTRIQLSELERFYQYEKAKDLMFNGATLADPRRVEIRGELNCGMDNFIDVNAVFVGQVRLGKNVTIGPNCIVIDSSIGDNVEIKANTVIEKSTICNSVSVGPFARVRPGTYLDDNSKIGNFVEVKNTQVGKGSKITHLSYIGDSELGQDVNVGAGTITCNYDGAYKHKTVMGDDSFIGSNSSLVAPLNIGKNATIGAGSTITKDVPDKNLSIARSLQKNILNWVRPKNKK